MSPKPAPLKIHVGRKGLDAAGKNLAADASERDQFLGRNRLFFGKMHGLVLANDKFAELGIDEVDTGSKMFDACRKGPRRSRPLSLVGAAAASRSRAQAHHAVVTWAGIPLR